MIEAEDWRDLCAIMRSLTWGRNEISERWHRLRKRVEARDQGVAMTKRIYVNVDEERRRTAMKWTAKQCCVVVGVLSGTAVVLVFMVGMFVMRYLDAERQFELDKVKYSSPAFMVMEAERVQRREEGRDKAWDAMMHCISENEDLSYSQTRNIVDQFDKQWKE